MHTGKTFIIERRTDLRSDGNGGDLLSKEISFHGSVPESGACDTAKEGIHHTLCVVLSETEMPNQIIGFEKCGECKCAASNTEQCPLMRKIAYEGGPQVVQILNRMEILK